MEVVGARKCADEDEHEKAPVWAPAVDLMESTTAPHYFHERAVDTRIEKVGQVRLSPDQLNEWEPLNHVKGIIKIMVQQLRHTFFQNLNLNLTLSLGLAQLQKL